MPFGIYITDWTSISIGRLPTDVPIVVDNDVRPRYVGHGGATGVARVARKVSLKIIAHCHAGDGVVAGQGARLHQMPLFETVGTNGLWANFALVSRLPAIETLGIFARSGRRRGVCNGRRKG